MTETLAPGEFRAAFRSRVDGSETEYNTTFNESEIEHFMNYCKTTKTTGKQTYAQRLSRAMSNPWPASIPGFTKKPVSAVEREWLGASVAVSPGWTVVNGKGVPTGDSVPSSSVGHVVGQRGAHEVWIHIRGLGFVALPVGRLERIRYSD